MPMKHHAVEVQEESQPQVQLLKKPFNTQVHVQQHHRRQQRPIPVQTSNVKKKVSIQIHVIAKNTTGVWTVDRRIWELLHINSLAHLV